MPSLAKPGWGEFAELYKQRRAEEQRAMMEPYADLLEVNLLGMLKQSHPFILWQLRKSEGTIFKANVFSWNTVKYLEPLHLRARRLSAMTPEERDENEAAEHSRKHQIAQEGWETTFNTECHVAGYALGQYSRRPVKVERIFRNSNLKQRISLALGPNFYPYIWSEKVVEVADSVKDQGYVVLKRTLTVRYSPFGLNKHEIKKLLDVAKSQAKRKAEGLITTYDRGEYGVGYAQLRIEPPYPPSTRGDCDPYICRRSACTCRYECSDSEDDRD
jgi:hypothetical protein